MEQTGTGHIISLENVSIGYQQDAVLLSNIRLRVGPGELVALIGRNGTGKSTLLKSMIGLLPGLGGAFNLEGKPIHQYDLPERARLVSFVSSQITHLPSLTVGELVALGRLPYTGWMGRLGPSDHALVNQALEEVQMGLFAHRKVERLSDGERQRAMIARAFVQDTRLMVLDEPTAFLDIPNTFDLIRILSRFRDRGKSIVYSTHDLETAMLCADKMWVIHEGEILEGAPEDLGLSGLFDDLFRSSGIGYDEPSGRFLFKRSSLGSIRLEGEDETARGWTTKTLERLGYQVNSRGEMRLHIKKSDASYEWTLEQNGDTFRFSSLYKLARFLIQGK